MHTPGSRNTVPCGMPCPVRDRAAWDTVPGARSCRQLRYAHRSAHSSCGGCACTSGSLGCVHAQECDRLGSAAVVRRAARTPLHCRRHTTRTRARTCTHTQHSNGTIRHTTCNVPARHTPRRRGRRPHRPPARRRRIRSTRRAPRRCSCRSTQPRCSTQRLCRCCCPRDPHARSWPRSSCAGVARADGCRCASQPLWSAVATCRCRPDARACVCTHQCVHLLPSRSAAHAVHAHTP
jgi:hypothetical protein